MGYLKEKSDIGYETSNNQNRESSIIEMMKKSGYIESCELSSGETAIKPSTELANWVLMNDSDISKKRSRRKWNSKQSF